MQPFDRTYENWIRPPLRSLRRLFNAATAKLLVKPANVAVSVLQALPMDCQSAVSTGMGRDVLEAHK